MFWIGQIDYEIILPLYFLHFRGINFKEVREQLKVYKRCINISQKNVYIKIEFINDKAKYSMLGSLDLLTSCYLIVFNFN